VADGEVPNEPFAESWPFAASMSIRLPKLPRMPNTQFFLSD